MRHSLHIPDLIKHAKISCCDLSCIMCVVSVSVLWGSDHIGGTGTNKQAFSLYSNVSNNWIHHIERDLLHYSAKVVKVDLQDAGIIWSEYTSFP